MEPKSKKSERKCRRHGRRNAKDEVKTLQVPTNFNLFSLPDDHCLKLIDIDADDNGDFIDTIPQKDDVRDENKLLKKQLIEKDEEIKHLQRKCSETTQKTVSVPSDIAAVRIVELSRKIREMSVELESEKTKNKQLHRTVLSLETQTVSESRTKSSAFNMRPERDTDTNFKNKEKQIQSQPRLADVKNEMTIDLREKLNSSQTRLAEYRNTCQSLKKDLKKAHKVLLQEVGDGSVLQNAMSGTGWRGRAQQILHLQNKLAELKEQYLKQKSSIERNGEVDVVNRLKPVEKSFAVAAVNEVKTADKSSSVATVATVVTVDKSLSIPSVGAVETAEKSISVAEVPTEEKVDKSISIASVAAVHTVDRSVSVSAVSTADKSISVAAIDAANTIDKCCSSIVADTASTIDRCCSSIVADTAKTVDKCCSSIVADTASTIDKCCSSIVADTAKTADKCCSSIVADTAKTADKCCSSIVADTAHVTKKSSCSVASVDSVKTVAKRSNLSAFVVDPAITVAEESCCSTTSVDSVRLAMPKRSNLSAFNVDAANTVAKQSCCSIATVDSIKTAATRSSLSAFSDTIKLAGKSSAAVDIRHKEDIKKLEKNRKEENEKSLNVVKLLETERTHLREKWLASKSRIQILNNENKQYKIRISALKSKGAHDDELIKAFSEQMTVLQRKTKQLKSLHETDLDVNEVKKEYEEEVEKLRKIIEDREERIVDLQEEIKAIKNSLVRRSDSSLSSQGSNSAPAMRSNSSIVTRGVQSSELATDSRNGILPELVEIDSDIEELHIMCHEYRTVARAAQVEKEKLLELVTVLNKRVEEATDRAIAAEEHVHEIQLRNVQLEKTAEKANLETSGKNVKRYIRPIKDVTVTIEQLKSNIQLVKEEKEVLKVALHNILQAKEDDLNVYQGIISHAQEIFSKGLREHKER